MGYPMTWRRLLNRNHLGDGDYGESPQYWRLFVRGKPVNREGFQEGVDIADVMQTMLDHQDEAAEQANARAAMFAGDLRRLERDTLDERLVCQEIARRLDFDPDVVAAVLKEWMAT